MSKRRDDELEIPDDGQLHKDLDEITKIEQVCRKALASGEYDAVQTMLLREALRDCKNAKECFVLSVNAVKGDLEALKEWRDEILETAPTAIKEEAE
jgi:hypothetical protein